MLVRVEARTRSGTLLDLPLDDASNGIVVAEIEGLGPVKANIVSSSFAQSDGEQYHSSKREARDMKFKVEFHPDYIDHTVTDLRDQIYDFFMPKSVVDLRFHTSTGLYVDIVGHVEDCEAPQFTEEPGADITLRCLQPDFIDPNLVTDSGMSTPLDVEKKISYKGNAEAGMVFRLFPDRPVSEATIYHRRPDGTLRTLVFAGSLVAGDVLTISTVSGAKGASLKRANTESSILWGVSPQSNWHELEKGDNFFRVYAEGAPFPYDIEYVTRYGAL